MNNANYLNEIISLSTLPREHYQKYYEAGIHDKITCAHCGEAVRLYLGIKRVPHFYHAYKESDISCEEFCHTLITNTAPKLEEETVEQNGFRLPKSRAITLEREQPLTSWRSSETVKITAPFQDKKKESSQLYGISLDKEQLKAVTKTEGSLLVLAGAGSGKTRVLTTRTLYMIEEKQIAPESLLLVTFTTKAAREMQNRISANRRHYGQNLVSGTFHSIFYKILLHHNREQWAGENLIKWDWQKEQYLKSACSEFGIDEKDFAFDQALQQIGLWKNRLQHYTNIKAANEWEKSVLTLYKYYEEKKEANRKFDFDDMLIKCYELLLHNESLLQAYQERFRYFLIDEFQDINPVQYNLIKLLSDHTKNLCVVGDDDQAIYSFRGSEPEFILNFKHDYPQAEIVHLSENYRSDHAIVTAANEVIKKNRNRFLKKMAAQSNSEQLPTFFFPFDEEEEATVILTDIKERIRDGSKPDDFAILYRTNSAGRAIFERLIASNIPFTTEYDQAVFYERKIVRSLLSYLRLSINPDDVHAMGDLLRALFIKQAALNDLKAFTILHDCTMIEALLKLEDLKSFQLTKLKKIVPKIKTLKNMKPLEAISTIEKELGFHDFLKKQGNEGNTIEKGSDDINDLKVVAKKFSTVHELLEHADHITATQKALKKDRTHKTGVQLMTIHRSKGLEFENVYIIGAVDGSIPHDFSLDSHRKGDSNHLEEERRLLYVAMTRAKRNLMISVPLERRGKNAVISRFIRSFLTEKIRPRK
ncbi:ATP-dependent helicase [Metabacillus fastidiosus]|uniref:ATP-dependent helicase n=1 Tax=Metabacillus fastidiosus TaxID=1458 RepID=UPI002DB74CFA|nr:ATP-dependent helicase [Metabacillus fastidiosus]MEC2077062.1 ATP-dependent helicase [Metabacillus fastidiosus]